MVRAGLAFNDEGMTKSELRIEFCDTLLSLEHACFLAHSCFVIRPYRNPASSSSAFVFVACKFEIRTSIASMGGARPFFCAALAPVPIRPGDRADLRAWSPFGAVESRDTAVSPPTHDRDATPCSLFL